MLVVIENEYLEKLYESKPVPGKPRFAKEIVDQFRKKVDILKNVANSQELRNFKSLHFEKLEGYTNLWSIRVNRSYRIEFRLENEELTLVEIAYIEELSNHYQ